MKKSFFIGLFLGLLSLSSFAQTRTEDFDLDPMRALIYEQEGLRYEDLQGDLYLLALRKKLGVKRGFAMLFGGFRKILDRDLELIEQAWAENPDWESIYRDYFSFQEREGIENPLSLSEEISKIQALGFSRDLEERLIVEVKNRHLHIEGRNNPLNVSEFKEMLTQVIYEEWENGNIYPSEGRVHHWSEGLREVVQGQFKIWTKFSKLLLTLSSGTSAQFMATGHEKALMEWMIEQKKGSIEIASLFRKSYQLSSGDLYLTLLSIENVLSKFWRYEKRDEIRLISNLAPITNSWLDNGDKFGAWYHLFGLMLYGYVEGSFKARLAGMVETIGSHFAYGFEKENQQDWINAQSGELGSYLKKLLVTEKWKEHSPSPRYLESSSYLNLDEDYRDRIEVVRDSRFLGELESFGGFLVFKIKSLELDLKGCHLDVILDTGRGLDSRNLIKEDSVSFKKGRWSQVLIPSNTRRVRAFMAGCVQVGASNKLD